MKEVLHPLVQRAKDNLPAEDDEFKFEFWPLNEQEDERWGWFSVIESGGGVCLEVFPQDEDDVIEVHAYWPETQKAGRVVKKEGSELLFKGPYQRLLVTSDEWPLAIFPVHRAWIFLALGLQQDPKQLS